MKSYLSELKKDYDFILIDCMAGIFLCQKINMEVSRLKKLKERLKRGLAMMMAAASIVSVFPSMNVSAASETAKITFAYCHDGAGNTIKYQQTVTHDGRVCGEAGEARNRIYADGDKQYVPHVLRYYIFGRIPTGTGSGAIVQVALTQEGNGGDAYWSWYGFDSRVEWCACFVSWCAEQCGYLIKRDLHFLNMYQEVQTLCKW